MSNIDIEGLFACAKCQAQTAGSTRGAPAPDSESSVAQADETAGRHASVALTTEAEANRGAVASWTQPQRRLYSPNHTSPPRRWNKQTTLPKKQEHKRDTHSTLRTPTDIFTPPKEVFVTPATATIKVSKSSKRKSTTKKKKRLTPVPVVVKLEMPDVDLTAPMPPPSPGDDPLLLSSSVEPPSSTPTRPRTRSPWMAFSESDALPVGRAADAAPVSRTVSPTPLPFHKLRFADLPPSSSPGENLYENQPSPIIEDQDLDITPPDLPFFELGDNVNDDGWSDSGDELPMLPPPEGSPTKEGEGEFTGKFLEVLVKTKADPPSSVTKGRMDEWGNPKSPYPLSLEKSPFPLPREKRRADLDVLKEAEEREDEDREEEEEVRRMSVEPEPELQEPGPFDFSGIESLPDESQGRMSVEQHEETYSVPLRDEAAVAPSTSIEVEEDIQEGPSAEDAFKLMGNEPLHDEDAPLEESSEDLQYPEDDSHEEAPIILDQDLQPSSIEEDITPAEESLSLPLDNSTENAELHEITPSLTNNPTNGSQIDVEVEHDPELSDDEPSSSSDASASPDIVKITSADPRAAARAAAILKQHNYDCFTKREMKRRYSDISRRRTMSPGSLVSARSVLGGGIEKQKERRKTVGGGGMGVRGERVYIPGSPATTLPKLLRDAEAEVSMSMTMSVDESTGSPNPFMLRSFLKDKTDSYKTPLPIRFFSPVLPQTQAQAEGSLTALANKMNTSLNLSLTPKVPMTPGEMCYDPLTGERMWTKEEWKRLDACFTDERVEVGQRMGLCRDDESLLSEGRMVDGWEKWEGMAGVDDVDLENVVSRFVDWMGGWEEVDGYGPEWSRESLMSRVKALRSKQRKGKVAPPTSLPFSPSTALASMSLATPSPFDFSFMNRGVEMDVPQFTPIRRTTGPGVLRKRREWASIVGPASSTPISGATSEMEASTSTPVSRPDVVMRNAGAGVDLNAKPVPGSLLAPRYSHLWEEAVKVSKDLPDVTKALQDVRADSKGHDHGMEQENDTALEEPEMEQDSEDSRTTPTLVEDEGNSLGSEPSGEMLEEEDEEEVEDELEWELEPEPESEPATIGKRVKGIIFSYLPTLRKTPSTSNATSTHDTNSKPRKLRSRPSTRPGLPLPPQEVLSKPRGPVVTPARAPLPKPVHPKELVNLQQAPPIQPPASKIPRVVHPRQLVELHHVTPKVMKGEEGRLEKQRRQRRSSGASVKDLIKGFEQMKEMEGKESNDEKRKEVRRMKSVGEWRKDVGDATNKNSGEAGRPVWKP
ncbi:hypothetical protein D9756_009318 [Leucocoprinus leucothites]|uniref:Uncharacterized protein n=1 Tax=Leucocoprinus leucothites TaxID=201217 RepID=A0A8H5CWC0_9AGAR|nr:hypothetical protein D9756_009318 [Leucoagaricus leucothites]